jgi:hypothetical protein
MLFADGPAYLKRAPLEDECLREMQRAVQVDVLTSQGMVVVDRDAQRFRSRPDLARHIDVVTRRLRIITGVIVDQDQHGGC